MVTEFVQRELDRLDRELNDHKAHVSERMQELRHDVHNAQTAQALIGATFEKFTEELKGLRGDVRGLGIGQDALEAFKNRLIGIAVGVGFAFGLIVALVVYIVTH